MIKKILALLLSLMLAMPSVAGAKGVYIAGATQGDDSGTSCATAHDESWFSAQDNWGTDAADMTPGDTIYFCDDAGPIDGQLIVRATGTSDALYYFAPAFGDAPVLSYSATQGFLFGVAGRGCYQIDGLGTLTFAGGAALGRIVYFFGQHDVEVKNIICDSDTSQTCLDIYTSTADSYNINFHHNDFRSNGTMEGIRMAQAGANAKHPYNISITDNIGDYLKNFIFGTADADVWSGGHRVEGLTVARNDVDHTRGPFMGLPGGINGATLASTIEDNHVGQCGDSDYPMVNCLQLHWINEVDVIDNRIDSVDTASCDGCGIILDWSNTDDTLLSTGNYVARNIIKNTNAACGGRGISIFKGTGNLVEHNLVSGSSGMGLRNASNESSGNRWIGNTVISPNVCFSQADGDNIGNTTTWINNLCDSPTSKGFETSAGSVAVEHDNLVYNAPDNDITLDATDLTDNPLLDAQGRPRLKSLFDAGTTHDNVYCGPGEPIGAYELCKGVSMPPPLWFLGTPDSYSLGGGRVHVELVTFGGESATFGGEAVTW